ncbi:hypothetical protein CONPUDRAFT_151861 [Coniophora puteana RWD-64-598 SS2]|uniref:Ribosomal RNA-processing protein 17 n=1 Tax=Coniophora puteana (strain RWD-64-598) TaxID=741705 RepID=A0A5M3MVR4_CONPW|nr:uncharacterized protein CONPUDRAFT_151861 [Coniophora puteana RWD-64-598 SS2]EIW82804.1 hypothetical protein CONPUDRAFT_151861 [Coniophora puteana RWD-64-598 SS2]
MSNLAILTRHHDVRAAKRRAKKDQINEIVFDDAARREYLTGFHKRKVAKQKAAKEKAVARDKEARLEARREHRRLLAERAAQNAAEVEGAYGAAGGSPELANSGNGWDGLTAGPDAQDDAGVEEDMEFENEEQLATVTVVEDFDPSSFIYGPEASTSETDPHGDSRSAGDGGDPRTRALPKGKAKNRDDGRAEKKGASVSSGKKEKAKGKKVKYETKAERKTTRTKQFARRTEKAERAGGKVSKKGRRR